MRSSRISASTPERRWSPAPDGNGPQASGPVELSGPDDPNPAFDDKSQRQLLRDIYHAVGGHHPDLDAYDRAMLDERRCAVIIHPTRTWTNPTGSEHLEPQDTR